MPAKRPRAAMRVQLREQAGPGTTIHHASIALMDVGAGVTTRDVMDALTRHRNTSRIPHSVGQLADDVLARALGWVWRRPPGGVSGRVSQSFYFDRQNPGHSYRFDIENITGTNLTI